MPPKRPARRDHTITFRVPEELHQKADQKARRQGRKLSGILRAWLKQWAASQVETPPKAADEDTRAQKQPRKDGGEE